MTAYAPQLRPLSWSALLGTWHLSAGWIAVSALLLAGYAVARWRAAARSTVAPWRVAAFAVGVVLMLLCVSSAVGGYARALFWMHMVMHLSLIMVVPALLVLGHPLTAIAECLPPTAGQAFLRVLRSRPVGLVTHYATGLVVYAAVVIGTHLTDFLDQVARHGWLVWGEQALYLVAGYLFLLPLLGEEPLRRRPPYLVRLVILVAAMLPDTIVGIVLLQSDAPPFPALMDARPVWAPDALADLHVGGALMWALGDGLMMAVAVALIASVITSPARRELMTGAWLEEVRRNALMARLEMTDHESAGPTAGSEELADADSDEAWEAYNRMLARLRDHDEQS